MSFHYGMEPPIVLESPEPPPELQTEAELQNKATAGTLYKALAHGDTGTVAGVLASDLEWWFHGPPGCQHMMRVLTGNGGGEFPFEPRSITAVGENCVIAEGWEGGHEHAYWVHVWTLNKEGKITQFREYFNTWLTVRVIRPPTGWEINGHQQQQSLPALWRSQPRDLAKRSLPGLVLAIF